MTLRGIAIGTALAALAGIVFFSDARLSVSLIVTFTALAVIVGGMVATIVDPDEPRIAEPWLDLRGGARREVSRTAGSLIGSRGRAAAAGAERLARIAARRLARRGIDLADPAQRHEAEALLGSLAYRVVTEPSEQPLAVLERAVAAVDRLDDGGAESRSAAS